MREPQIDLAPSVLDRKDRRINPELRDMKRIRLPLPETVHGFDFLDQWRLGISLQSIHPPGQHALDPLARALEFHRHLRFVISTPPLLHKPMEPRPLHGTVRGAESSLACEIPAPVHEFHHLANARPQNPRRRLGIFFHREHPIMKSRQIRDGLLWFFP
jgi:hypothetical protein